MKQSALTSLGRGGAANILVKGPGQLTRGDLPVWGPGARLSTSQNKKKASSFEMLPRTYSFGRNCSVGNGTETLDLECEEIIWTRVTKTGLGIRN